jgi:hypothetical protein
MRTLIAVLMAGPLVAAACGPAPAASTSIAAATSQASASPDGAWHEQTVLSPDPKTFAKVAAQRALIAGDQTSWVELDGGSWMPAEAVNTSDRIGIVYWHGSLISWADGGEIQVSRDGLAWTDAVSGPGDSNPVTMVPYADRLLLFGDGVSSPVGAWQSADGSTWTPIDPAPTGMKAAATMSGRGLIAVGWTGPGAAAWSTRDTRTWDTLAGLQPIGSTTALHGVAATGSHVVAIGDIDGAAAVWNSDDLGTWTMATSTWGDDAYLSSLIDLDGAFLIAGRRGGRPVVWRSADGLSWTTVDLPTAPTTDAEAVHVTIQADRLVVFGYSDEDAGNGGSFHTGYLVWTLDLHGTQQSN